MRVKPGTLAKRAVHQYRRRDILAYVSLRLYLKNQSALRDRWPQEIASELVLDQNQPSYNHILYFKEMEENGCCKFRDFYVPGPNEILAETALLAECANTPRVFQPPKEVFSYRLSSRTETQGVYKHYFYGFNDRNRTIMRACRRQRDALVLYTDIKKFYPSVKIDLAKKVWSEACDDGNLSERNRKLGMKLLDNYEQTNSNDPALLIGPMFSHLIGNLVLRDIDSKMAAAAPGRYFRYVDDFVFVAPREEAYELEENLKSMLNELNLELHSKDKKMEVCVSEWLKGQQEGQHFFNDENSQVSWKNFIGGLKLFMLFHPERRDVMESRLRDAGIRIRPLDYSKVIQDRDYSSLIRSLTAKGWLKKIISDLSQDRIISKGLQLRSRYMEEFDRTLTQLPGSDSDSFGRKMSISRLRFLLSRLGYLAAPDKLHTIADAIDDINEVAIFAAIFRALANRDVSELLKFGSNAAQSVAQPLKMDPAPVGCSIPGLEKEVAQAYAILQLNQIPLEGHNGLPESPMLTFCQGGNGLTELFESSDMYFRELACLHGLDEPDVLRRTLETAFDPDDGMASDMIDIMHMSYWT